MRPEPAPRALVDDLFRHGYGQLVARLTRSLGPEHLDLVEDVVQEALLRALRTWPIQGPPADPEAWLARVARNGALDALRRHATLRDKCADLERWSTRSPGDVAADDEELRDDQLRLIFTCCHPALTRDARVSLTLKLLGGFGVAELAGAFLVSERTMAQRLVRAKATLRREGVAFEIPGPSELNARLDSVLDVLYLMFNEGYSALRGPELVRGELVDEAMRLATLVRLAPALVSPKVHALLALMSFQAARLPARQAHGGLPLPLEEQDRTRWDRGLIRTGFAHLERAGRGTELSRYHLEAGIASCHAAAATFAETPWETILGLYDDLAALAPSPIVSLNRAVAVAMVAGPAAGLAELDALEGHPLLARYYLLPATRGELHRRSGDPAAAAEAFRRALELAGNEPERRLLERKLAEGE